MTLSSQVVQPTKLAKCLFGDNVSSVTATFNHVWNQNNCLRHLRLFYPYPQGSQSFEVIADKSLFPGRTILCGSVTATSLLNMTLFSIMRVVSLFNLWHKCGHFQPKLGKNNLLFFKLCCFPFPKQIASQKWANWDPKGPCGVLLNRQRQLQESQSHICVRLRIAGSVLVPSSLHHLRSVRNTRQVSSSPWTSGWMETSPFCSFLHWNADTSNPWQSRSLYGRESARVAWHLEEETISVVQQQSRVHFYVSRR